jgi:hypothetical protein
MENLLKIKNELELKLDEIENLPEQNIKTLTLHDDLLKKYHQVKLKIAKLSV